MVQRPQDRLKHDAAADNELAVEATISAIRTAARDGLFVSFSQVAMASGVVWTDKVRLQMLRHLELVCELMLPEARAMISSIVVNEKNLATGELKSRSLAGFADCAVRLGLQPGSDYRSFLKKQQSLTFEWGKRTSI